MSNLTDAPNMNMVPRKPSWYLTPIRRLMNFGFSGFVGANTKIIKHGRIKSFKEEPALIVCNHASMYDFSNIDKVIKPAIPQYVASIEEFNKPHRYILMTRIGNFPKRKFTLDFNIVRSLKTIVDKYHNSVCLFPETRFSFAGIPEHYDDGIAKLAKLLKVRVITIIQRGNYLSSPQWCKHPYKPVQSYVDVYETPKEEVINTDAVTLQNKLVSLFDYNEYKWYNENGPKSKNKLRANGLHHILYKCPVCGTEFEMDSKRTKIWCNHCHSEWEMADNYELIQKNGKSKFKLVPDWYVWEREEFLKDIKKNGYRFEDDVDIQHIDSWAKGFVYKGKVHMIYDQDGLRLDGTLDNGEEFHYLKECKDISDIHIEFNYAQKGRNAIDVNTNTDTWFVFPINKTKEKEIMKLNWAGRYYYEKFTKGSK